MPRLEVLLKDGGIEEFETTPVTDSAVTTSTTPTQPPKNTFIKTAILLTVGKQALNGSINMIGLSTGDYILERGIKKSLTTIGVVGAFAKAPLLTAGGVLVSQGLEARERYVQRTRKQYQAQQNIIAIGAITTRQSEYRGAK